MSVRPPTIAHTPKENRLCLPYQPSAVRSTSARAEGCLPLPSPCWNADWLDLVGTLQATRAAGIQWFLSCSGDTQFSLTFGSYNLSASSSAMFPEPWWEWVWHRCLVRSQTLYWQLFWGRRADLGRERALEGHLIFYPFSRIAMVGVGTS